MFFPPRLLTSGPVLAGLPQSWTMVTPKIRTTLPIARTKHRIQIMVSSELFSFLSFIPTAIYLAKKNIRKQGELMEYEKVTNCVCIREKMYCGSWGIIPLRDYTLVLFCFWCLFLSFFLMHCMSFFLPFRRDTVCCTRGSTTPGTLWWCKPESNSGSLSFSHTLTHMHTLTHTHTHTHTHTD